MAFKKNGAKKSGFKKSGGKSFGKRDYSKKHRSDDGDGEENEEREEKRGFKKSGFKKSGFKKGGYKKGGGGGDDSEFVHITGLFPSQSGKSHTVFMKPEILEKLGELEEDDLLGVSESEYGLSLWVRKAE